MSNYSSIASFFFISSWILVLIIIWILLKNGFIFIKLRLSSSSSTSYSTISSIVHKNSLMMITRYDSLSRLIVIRSCKRYYLSASWWSWKCVAYVVLSCLGISHLIPYSIVLVLACRQAWCTKIYVIGWNDLFPRLNINYLFEVK